MNIKRVSAAAVIAGSYILLSAGTSFAGGPLMLGPVRAPIAIPRVFVTPSTRDMSQSLLSTYRQVRTFWLSRAIVR